MRQIISYGDRRTTAACAFCAGMTGTRDHCPSRVFLDKPYPENLPVVPACPDCNSGFSSDEQYLACLLACVIAGSTEPDAMPREKINRILRDNPRLRERLEKARTVADGETIFAPEHERVARIITKLAQGHALYELHESCAREPSEVWYLPLPLMDHKGRDAFENPESEPVWPEVGSRAMQRLICDEGVSLNGWLIAQPDRYRYCAILNGGVEVRIVIHEYLACRVLWGD